MRRLKPSLFCPKNSDMYSFIYSIFSKAEQKVLLFVIFFLIIGSVLNLAGYNADSEAQAALADSLDLSLSQSVPIKLDIRVAEAKALVALPGIGIKRAETIVEYREKYGFQNLSDLINIKGIGAKTYSKLYPYVIPFGDSLLPDEDANAKPKQSKTDGDEKIILPPVNINTASLEELCSLSGIGKTKAQAIIDYRDRHGAFEDIHEITKVPGIGIKTLAKNQERIEL